ncbi:hypothetical protein YQE_02564, partial [Dendroctonus ponderosae]
MGYYGMAENDDDDDDELVAMSWGSFMVITEGKGEATVATVKKITVAEAGDLLSDLAEDRRMSLVEGGDLKVVAGDTATRPSLAYIAHLPKKRFLTVVHVLWLRQSLSPNSPPIGRPIFSLQLLSNFKNLKNGEEMSGCGYQAGPNGAYLKSANDGLWPPTQSPQWWIGGHCQTVIARRRCDLVDFMSQRSLVFLQLLHSLLQASHVLHYLVCESNQKETGVNVFDWFIWTSIVSGRFSKTLEVRIIRSTSSFHFDSQSSGKTPCRLGSEPFDGDLKDFVR